MNIAYDFLSKEFNAYLDESSLEILKDGGKISTNLYFTAGTEILFRKLLVSAHNISSFNTEDLKIFNEDILRNGDDLVFVRGRDSNGNVKSEIIPFKIYISSETLNLLNNWIMTDRDPMMVFSMKENKKIVFHKSIDIISSEIVAFLRKLEHKHAFFYAKIAKE